MRGACGAAVQHGRLIHKILCARVCVCVCCVNPYIVPVHNLMYSQLTAMKEL